MSQANDDLRRWYDIYTAENMKFEDKHVKASATRARKALAEIIKTAKIRRAEILAEKK